MFVTFIQVETVPGSSCDWPRAGQAAASGGRVQPLQECAPQSESLAAGQVRAAG